LRIGRLDMPGSFVRPGADSMHTVCFDDANVNYC
jgi:hypothetical protein